MFVEESVWILKNLRNVSKNKSILDIGSGSLEYVMKEQPYINDLYLELKARGYILKTMDMDPNSGADIIGDISSIDLGSSLYDIITTCSLFEHIERGKIDASIRNIYKLLKDGGICLVSVSFNLPLHLHPIDNGLRPTCNELQELFNPYFNCESCFQLVCKHYKEPYISNLDLYPLPIVTCGVFRKR